MTNKNLRILFTSILIFGLTGCDNPIEERTENAVQRATIIFERTPMQPTKDYNEISLYKPSGWKLDISHQENRFTLTNNNKTVIGDYDVNAAQDSRTFYELYKANSSLPVIEEETFIAHGTFGFVVISQQSKTHVELVTGSGHVRLQSIVETDELDEMAEKMMKITKSVDIHP